MNEQAANNWDSGGGQAPGGPERAAKNGGEEKCEAFERIVVCGPEQRLQVAPAAGMEVAAVQDVGVQVAQGPNVKTRGLPSDMLKTAEAAPLHAGVLTHSGALASLGINGEEVAVPPTHRGLCDTFAPCRQAMRDGTEPRTGWAEARKPESAQGHFLPDETLDADAAGPSRRLPPCWPPPEAPQSQTPLPQTPANTERGATEEGKHTYRCSVQNVPSLGCVMTDMDVKPNAQCRMQDLQSLLADLNDKRVITLKVSDQPHGNSLLGFAEINVHALVEFNACVRQMVLQDKMHCWLVNGRKDIKEPTGPVYELLRQLGVKPVRGTRGPLQTDPGKRDFIYYSRYTYEQDLMLRNRNRLQPGFIGRAHRHHSAAAAVVGEDPEAALIRQFTPTRGKYAKRGKSSDVLSSAVQSSRFKGEGTVGAEVGPDTSAVQAGVGLGVLHPGLLGLVSAQGSSSSVQTADIAKAGHSVEGDAWSKGKQRPYSGPFSHNRKKNRGREVTTADLEAARTLSGLCDIFGEAEGGAGAKRPKSSPQEVSRGGVQESRVRENMRQVGAGEGSSAGLAGARRRDEHNAEGRSRRVVADGEHVNGLLTLAQACTAW